MDTTILLAHRYSPDLTKERYMDSTILLAHRYAPDLTKGNGTDRMTYATTHM